MVVLKGHASIIADGRQQFVNRTGNPGMATGGTGDVLSGMVGALMVTSSSALLAARRAVHVHGLAGDLARDALGRPRSPPRICLPTWAGRSCWQRGGR
ncbi:MAG: NAD(P)H-hydrate dehydratase [Planctomycetota bacterium]